MYRQIVTDPCIKTSLHVLLIFCMPYRLQVTTHTKDPFYSLLSIRPKYHVPYPYQPKPICLLLGGGALSKGVSVKISFFRSKTLTFILRRRGSLKNRISKLREKKIRLLGDLLAPKTGQNGCFSAISSARTKNLLYSLFSIWQKYYESSKTEYSDSTSFINRLSLFFI